jgi:putative solute:sodium symporter small subunit
MKKVDKSVADAYFKARNTVIIVCLFIGFLASFGVMWIHDSLTFTFNGMPFYYWVGSQGAILTFIILLFANAIISDRIDRKFGIDNAKSESIASGSVLDH